MSRFQGSIVDEAGRHITTGEPMYRIDSPEGLFTTNCAYGGVDNKQLFITESKTGTILVIGRVVTHAADPHLLYACTNLGQLFRSDDGGNTWTRLEREFGEVRALHWRPVGAEIRQARPSTWTYK